MFGWRLGSLIRRRLRGLQVHGLLPHIHCVKLLARLIPRLPLYELSFDRMDGDVRFGTGRLCLRTGRHIENRCGDREDAAIWRNELYYEFGLALRGIGNREIKVTNLVGFEILFCRAV